MANNVDTNQLAGSWYSHLHEASPEEVSREAQRAQGGRQAVSTAAAQLSTHMHTAGIATLLGRAGVSRKGVDALHLWLALVLTRSNSEASSLVHAIRESVISSGDKMGKILAWLPGIDLSTGGHTTARDLTGSGSSKHGGLLGTASLFSRYIDGSGGSSGAEDHDLSRWWDDVWLHMSPGSKDIVASLLMGISGAGTPPVLSGWKDVRTVLLGKNLDVATDAKNTAPAADDKEEVSSRPPLVEQVVPDGQDPEVAAKAVGAPSWVGKLLADRGAASDGKTAREYLDGHAGHEGDPLDIVDMSKAVSILKAARWQHGQPGGPTPVCIFGDYDADGVTSTAVLVMALERAGGFDVRWRLPSRFSGGYGPDEASIKSLADDGVKVLVFVDTGVAATGPLRLAKKLGMSVIVVDHHLPQEGEDTGADAVVDPWADTREENSGALERDKALSASGLSYKLATQLGKELGVPGLGDEVSDIAALGLLADRVSMASPQNRMIVRKALGRMHRSHIPALRVLADYAESKVSGNRSGGSKLDRRQAMTSSDVGFALGPLLNAPGRMDAPDPALSLLLSSSEEDAREKLAELIEVNDSRRETEAAVLASAGESAAEIAGDHQVICVYGQGWHPGVLGIVASKLAERWGRPAAVAAVSRDVSISGSARGAPQGGFDWSIPIEAGKSAGVLTKGGGHAAAAGFTVAPGKWGEWLSILDASAVEQGFDPEAAVPVPPAEASPRLDEMDTHSASTWFARFEPWGPGNPEPLLAARGCTLVGEVLRQAKGTLSFNVQQGGGKVFQATLFSKGGVGRDTESTASFLESAGASGFDILYSPVWKSFGKSGNSGKSMLKLMVKAVGPSR